MMTKLRLPVMLAVLALLAACVTINVYFPAAAAQEAADRIINRVYGSETGGEKPPAEPQPNSQPQSVPQPQSRHDDALARILIATLEWMVAPAAAAAPNIDIKSPAIQGLTASMEARHASLAPYYASGAIGMTQDGQIAARDLNAIALRDRSKVQQLIADENKDRSALYAEIARANGHPEWENDIRATFARRWIDNAPSGWWYQDAGGGWKQK